MALSISPCYEIEFGTTVLSPNFMKTNIEFQIRFCGTEFNIRVISFPAHKTPFQPRNAFLMALSISSYMKTNIEFWFHFCGTEFNIRVISFLAPKTPLQPNKWVTNGT